MSFYPELDHLSLEQLIKHFRLPPPEREDAVLYFQEIAHLIATNGEDGVKFLWQESDKANTEKLQAILFALTETPLQHPFVQPELCKLLVRYLHDERPLIIMEAIDSLSRLGVIGSVKSVLGLREHSSPYVRSSVLRFMRTLYPEKALPLLIESLKDPDYIVRESAADELGELDSVEAIPFLNSLIEKDPHPDVRQAAQTSIDLISSVAC
ncbi:HEAT repeat domain-containing protein [Cylindrospermum sp. FACHB-282]|uniref:HEAT repeat domain-containing protein n=1 Tax=Cylindrospermum sp. FACHB-282 TaxID=2692794 RepID=UPI001684CEDA|nr:HEAT repeat domain-containing protein [Cylindrospermum sp. FACHB-282]MBD2388077.1 HEAT repeat domain-containing protein [Cylindrospermum sp. FACHB-282]